MGEVLQDSSKVVKKKALFLQAKSRTMKRFILLSFLFLFILISGVLRASVVDTTATGFSVKEEVYVPGDPAAVYKLFLNIGMWWDSAHTFSNNSMNLTLEAVPGGCFCEKLPNGGGVQHMRVIYVDPGKMIRLSGPIGPLQVMPVNGVMTIYFRKSGDQTGVTMLYFIGGTNPDGWKQFATIVDNVLGQQMTRFQRYAEVEVKKGK
jgi:hypothetical protein